MRISVLEIEWEKLETDPRLSAEDVDAMDERPASDREMPLRGKI